MKREEEKARYFMQPRIDICGSWEDPRTHIYQLCHSRLMVREIEVLSGKGGEPIGILQISDMHLNAMNQRDWEENNPSVMSTREYRTAFRDRYTVPNAVRAMELAQFYDQVILTGDIIDYLTYGSLELMRELVWEPCRTAMAAVGGHDITRVMQGRVPDPSTLESRYGILGQYWRHDLFYSSKVLGNKVMVIQMNNGESRYYDFQVKKLAGDMEKARKENLILLIFQHEPLCTRNPEESHVEPVRIGDPDGDRNFCTGHLGWKPLEKATEDMYRLITENGDIIKGIFCGHEHSTLYTEILASYTEKGIRKETVIPQYVDQGNLYDDGHVVIITVK